MATVNAERFGIDGQTYTLIDGTARENAQLALNNAEYNRQGQIGKYGGQNIATILAGEIGSGTVYDAMHKRIANANFAGLRVGDYIDVPLVSASGVAAQQSVRFLLAHFDPYYCCGDSSKGHHIAFVASAPIAVAKTVTGVANDSFLMWNTTNTNQAPPTRNALPQQQPQGVGDGLRGVPARELDQVPADPARPA